MARIRSSTKSISTCGCSGSWTRAATPCPATRPGCPRFRCRPAWTPTGCRSACSSTAISAPRRCSSRSPPRARGRDPTGSVKCRRCMSPPRAETMRITRRQLIQTAAAASFPLPAIAQPTKTLRYVPQANLSVLDPVSTAGGVALEHGFMVFDTLYGTDGDLVPRPQMAEGHSISDDQRTWLIRLRQGLKFHDGEPVRAVDAAASIQRWCKRDAFGQAVAAATEAVEAADDLTILVRLNRPPGPRLTAISHTTTSPP